MSEFKRRKFLKTSAAVAAGAAVGPFIWVKDANAQWSNVAGERAPSCACCAGAASSRATSTSTWST